jgi:antitoxin MazE
MQLSVRKWGNSLAIRIPKTIAMETDIGEGSLVEIRLKKGSFIVTPIRKTEYSLDELLAGVTDENIHGEIDMGAPVGKEQW